MNSLDAFRPECTLEELSRPEHVHDDFAAAGIDCKEDVRSTFDHYYFGCEADDRATMWAFDRRLGARLHPVFSSDFTHFDVPDFEEVMPEAFEMVERGFMSDAGLPRVHLHQCRPPAHPQQSRLLRRDGGGARRGGRAGVMKKRSVLMPSRSIFAPAPRATISPRSMTR